LAKILQSVAQPKSSRAQRKEKDRRLKTFKAANSFLFRNPGWNSIRYAEVGEKIQNVQFAIWLYNNTNCIFFIKKRQIVAYTVQAKTFEEEK